MNANAVFVLQLFEKKMSLEVPLFQRQYVWNQDQQWHPLWEDISTKFFQLLDGRVDAPVHFLGAMVLDQKQTPVTHVEKRQIIDGQQRLTTLQIFLAAFRDYCADARLTDIASECDTFILNSGMMANKNVDKFKVWPTERDRQQYRDVMELRSYVAINDKHPLVKLRYQRHHQPRPRMVDAYCFFYGQLKDFFGNSPHEHLSLGERAEACLSTLRNHLKVVVIDLDKDDDAQVIFETLNARGVPLLPADLLRNYIFLRAAHASRPAEELYELYWSKFDDVFWRQEIRQGRLSRPRSDLFMQHFLTSRQTEEIPIKHLFVEYKYWIDRARPFASVEEELATLSRKGDEFRHLLQPKLGEPTFRLATFLQVFDVSTLYPLMLRLLDAAIDAGEWERITTTIQSYILRRTVCNLTNKSYNRTFLALAKLFKVDRPTAARLDDYLRNLRGESGVWPNDAQFQESWTSQHAYAVLQSSRLNFVLRELNSSLLTSLSEDITINSPLTIEHIMPQSWQAHWPLMDGNQGLSNDVLWKLENTDPIALPTRKRNVAVQTFGNLTLLTSPLNASVSNSDWSTKKTAMLHASLLPINLDLNRYNECNEESISHRSAQLFERARLLWPGPISA